MDSHKFDKITQTMANELVRSYHHRTTSLGCWESNCRPRRLGYVYVDVRRGACRLTPGLHQLALIAGNRRDELKVTLDSNSFDISHLCHNNICFNPEHLIVESRLNNRRRQACNGHDILVHDGFSYHPCSHGVVEKMRKCILPVRPLQETMPNTNERPSIEATPAQDIHDIATTNNDTDAATAANKFDHITPTRAQELINRYRTLTTDLGCWQSNLKRTNGYYCRLNLRNLNRPFLHQLALIADNRGAELKRTLSVRNYRSVTHLCHNGQCFNPQHLIVESTSDNNKRKACKGNAILVREGITYHPCVHGGVNEMHKCILPLQHQQETMSNSDEQTSTDATPAPDLDDTATANDNTD
ncbi:zinc-binding loop region of homing endonuclease-domain-containing protein, partial [Lipomyces doorenjongii]|uniref:zinc-binding loop region of homing endonuclease-domain-containing protein n=1 Tax=Lipomyces doorenjongii TaxID=383834 RepID=UPI0034CE31F5